MSKQEILNVIKNYFTNYSSFKKIYESTAPKASIAMKEYIALAKENSDKYEKIKELINMFADKDEVASYMTNNMKTQEKLEELNGLAIEIKSIAEIMAWDIFNLKWCDWFATNNHLAFVLLADVCVDSTLSYRDQLSKYEPLCGSFSDNLVQLQGLMSQDTTASSAEL